MINVIFIALGGALGAVGRYWVSGFVVNNTDHYLPLGTLTVNILGSLLMGVFFVLVLEKSALPPTMRPFVMVGFLGAFTTFSTFSLETLVLLQDGHILSALIYILLSVICCIAALSAGAGIVRLLIS